MKTYNALFAGFISLLTIDATAQNTSPDIRFANAKMVSGLAPYPGAGDTMVELSWSTVKDNANSYFEVERSFDGNTFTTIALVLDGFRENDSTTTCKMKDRSAALAGAGKAYYRLKQVETDGTFSYSGMITVMLREQPGSGK